MDGFEDASGVVEFAPDEPLRNDALAAAMDRAHAALMKAWERDGAAMSDVYEISVPSQLIVVVGQQRALEALGSLKALGLSGFYKVRKGGQHDARPQERK